MMLHFAIVVTFFLISSTAAPAVRNVQFTELSETVEDISPQQLRGGTIEDVSPQQLRDAEEISLQARSTVYTWRTAEFFEDAECQKSLKVYKGNYHAKANTCLKNGDGTDYIKYSCDIAANTGVDTHYSLTDTTCSETGTSHPVPLGECVGGSGQYFKYSCDTGTIPQLQAKLHGVVETFFDTEAKCARGKATDVLQSLDIPITNIIMMFDYEPKFGESLEYNCHNKTAFKRTIVKGTKKYNKIFVDPGCSKPSTDSIYWTSFQCF